MNCSDSLSTFVALSWQHTSLPLHPYSSPFVFLISPPVCPVCTHHFHIFTFHILHHCENMPDVNAKDRRLSSAHRSRGVNPYDSDPWFWANDEAEHGGSTCGRGQWWWNLQVMPPVTYTSKQTLSSFLLFFLPLVKSNLQWSSVCT